MSFVLKMIEEGEHQRQDFKLRIDSSRKIAKTLVAFANTDGGRILIGVKDNGKIVGAKVQEEIHMIDAAVQMYCKPIVNYKAEIWHIDDKRILEINIKPSEHRPHYAEIKESNWLCYLRSEDRILQANGVLQKVWINDKNDILSEFQYDKEKEKLFRYMNRKGEVTFITVSRITKLSHPETEDLLSNLILWGVIKMNFDKNRITYSLKKEKT